jgi:hypothetical protein
MIRLLPVFGKVVMATAPAEAATPAPFAPAYMAFLLIFTTAKD